MIVLGEPAQDKYLRNHDARTDDAEVGSHTRFVLPVMGNEKNTDEGREEREAGYVEEVREVHRARILVAYCVADIVNTFQEMEVVLGLSVMVRLRKEERDGYKIQNAERARKPERRGSVARNAR